MTWPVVLASSVVRGARRDDVHGELWVVDVALQEARRVWVHDDPQISFEGRGGDRGLRGIAIVGDDIWVAASRALLRFSYDPLRDGLELVSTHPCPSLAHAHEMVWHRGLLWVTSTGYDSVLAFDPVSARYVWGLLVRAQGADLQIEEFDPTRPPPWGDTVHLNQVASDGEALTLSGSRTTAWLRIDGSHVDHIGDVPLGTHNVTPIEGGFIANDTGRDRVLRVRAEAEVAVPVPRVAPEALQGLHLANGPLARPSFARGLFVVDPDHVLVGSSPSTISAVDLAAGRVRHSVAVSRDVRRAIHGITGWPFDG